MRLKILLLSLLFAGWGCSSPGGTTPGDDARKSIPLEVAAEPGVIVERFLAEAEVVGEESARGLLPALVAAPVGADAAMARVLATLPVGTSGRRLLLTALLRRNAVPSWVEISERVLCCVEEVRHGGQNPAGALIALDRLRAMGVAADAPLRILAAAGGPRGNLAESLSNRLLSARLLLREGP